MKAKLFVIMFMALFFIKAVYSQSFSDTVLVSNGYSEIEISSGISIDFIKKELIKLASIDAIEKKFGKVLFSENNLEISNSSNKSSTDFRSTNKSIVKGEIKKVLSQKFEEKEYSGYAEVNGTKKLIITKVLSCFITCEVKELPINIEFSVQVDKIQSQVDSLALKVENFASDIQTLKSSNTIVNAKTLAEKLYNISQLLQVDKKSEAEVLINSYVEAINKLDSVELDNFIYQNIGWNKILSKKYSPVDDIIKKISDKGFNDFFGYLCVDFIDIEVVEIDPYNPFKNFQKYLELLSKYVPIDSRFVKTYITLEMIDKFEPDDYVLAFAGGSDKINQNETDFFKDTRKEADKLSEEWSIDKVNYPSLNILFKQGLNELKTMKMEDIKNYFILNKKSFSKFDKNGKIQDITCDHFIRLLDNFESNKNRYYKTIENSPYFYKYMSYEDLLCKIITPN